MIVRSKRLLPKSCCFKSHRDKVQINVLSTSGHTYSCFKSHRDKVQIDNFAKESGLYRVSNPIGTKFKFSFMCASVNAVPWFQIPQGQSSNNIHSPLKSFQTEVSNPIGTKFKSQNSYFFMRSNKVSNPIGTKFKFISAKEAPYNYAFQIPQGQSSNLCVGFGSKR